MGSPVDIQDLWFQYPEPHPVLAGVDLQLSDGEVLGLVGPNGAGKTTLFLILAGILGPDRGVVRVLGREAADPELRGRVAIVFQNVDDQLFSASVADDVAFGPLNLGATPEEAADRVREALAAVGMPGFEDRVPHHLSSGEKRKVAIAAVLSMRPDIFLLDEPNSDLDSRSRRELMELLKRIPGTKIIASHDYELLAEIADRVAILDRGRIQALGEPLELLSNREVIERHGLEVPPGLLALRRLRLLGEDPFSGA